MESPNPVIPPHPPDHGHFTCPKCGEAWQCIKDTRYVPTTNRVRRRRECRACHYRFTTYEYFEHPNI